MFPGPTWSGRCAACVIEQTRQVGSHLMLTTPQEGEHHVVVPNHNPVKIGTLNGILSDVAEHFGLSKAALIELLFR